MIDRDEAQRLTDRVCAMLESEAPANVGARLAGRHWLPILGASGLGTAILGGALLGLPGAFGASFLTFTLGRRYLFSPQRPLKKLVALSREAAVAPNDVQVVEDVADILRGETTAFLRVVATSMLATSLGRLAETEHEHRLRCALADAACTKKTPAQVRTEVRAALAASFARLGQLDDAIAHLPEKPVTVAGYHAIVYARSGQHERLRQLKTPFVAKRRRAHIAHELRVEALMRAFVAEGAERDEHLKTAKARFAGEFAYLASHWPELQSFLAEHAEALAPPTAPLPRATLKQGKARETQNSSESSSSSADTRGQADDETR